MIRALVLIVLLCVVGCTVNAPPDTMRINGAVLTVTIEYSDSDTLAAPVTLNIRGADGTVRMTLADSVGNWSIDDLPLQDYWIYATAQGYGRSRTVKVPSSPRTHSVYSLALYEEPHVHVTIDSVIGSSAIGYNIYASMHTQLTVSLALLIRDTGQADSDFIVWGRGTDIDYDTTRAEYTAWAAKDPELAGKEVAAVSYIGSTYSVGYHKERLCSHGPLSNIVTLK